MLTLGFFLLSLTSAVITIVLALRDAVGFQMARGGNFILHSFAGRPYEEYKRSDENLKQHQRLSWTFWLAASATIVFFLLGVGNFIRNLFN